MLWRIVGRSCLPLHDSAPCNFSPLSFPGNVPPPSCKTGDTWLDYRSAVSMGTRSSAKGLRRCVGRDQRRYQDPGLAGDARYRTPSTSLRQPLRCPKCHTADTKGGRFALTSRRRRLDPPSAHCTQAASISSPPTSDSKKWRLLLIRAIAPVYFDRSKVVAGIAAASEVRPVTAEQIEQLSIELEDHSVAGQRDHRRRVGPPRCSRRLRSLDVCSPICALPASTRTSTLRPTFQRELVAC